MTCELDYLEPGESVTFSQSFEMDTRGEDISFTYDTAVGSGSIDPASYAISDPEPANNQISGTITAVSIGSGGSVGCNTSWPARARAIAL